MHSIPLRVHYQSDRSQGTWPARCYNGTSGGGRRKGMDNRLLCSFRTFGKLCKSLQELQCTARARCLWNTLKKMELHL